MHFDFGIAALVALAAASISSASAADEASGRWAGAHLGATLAHHSVVTSGIFDGVEPGGTPDLKNIGGTGANLGVEAGYDWQWDHLIFGVAADASFAGFSRSYTVLQDGGPTEAGLFSYPIVGDVSYLATLRARAGLHANLMGRDVMLFATGGAAFARFNMNIADGRGRIAFDAPGTVVGGGVEVALSKQWSLSGEYLHHQFGKQFDMSDVGTSGVFDANDGNFVRLENVDIVRVGLNFRFR